MKKYGFLLLLLGFWISGYGQHEMSFYSMDSLWNKSLFNPSTQTKDNWTIALPGIYYGFDHSGDSFDNILKKEGRTLIIDKNAWLDGLEDETDLQGRFDLNTLYVAKRMNNLTLSFGHSFRSTFGIRYPKDLAQLIVRGNAPFIGQTLTLGTSQQFNSYSEFSAGVAWRFKLVSLGARLKYLNGIQFLETENHDLTLYTDDDIYQLRVNTNYSLRSSSFVSDVDIQSLTFRSDEINTYQIFSKNHGLALDLGARADILNWFSAEISVLDLGYINYQENNKRFSSNGEFTFDGLEVNDIIDLDSLEFNEVIDSVKSLLEFQEEDLDEIKYSLPSRVYLGFHFTPSERWRISLLYAQENIMDKSTSSYGVGLQFNATDWWSIGSTAAYRFEDFNVGLNSRMDLKVVQLYFATDNILGAFKLNQLSNTNLRFGLNFKF